MKKEWQNPLVEVLDVNKTMLGTEGDYTDNDFPAGTPRGDLTFS
ncbi:paeninodin family lasso peptide [Halobacillus campisalis]|uniref:Paeninodin family lasso peptide n=1 Tax=Halobacillus campisalis TaxID=435909 RepID=A0ABW2K7F5_9BACI|nr:paeninodin family lasso peptide [Halobacillus campisalis]